MKKYFDLEKILSIYKIIFFYTSFLIIFLLFPFIFLVIKITKFFFIIRITELLTNRYGHLVLNPEIYLLEKKKEEEKSKKYLDFFYESRHGICNKELLNLWKRKILIFPRNILEPIDILLKKIYSTNNIHTVSGFNDKVRDINCYFDNQEPSFILSQEQEKYCFDILLKNGIDIKKIRYVCLFNRDDAYLNSFKKKKDWYYLSHHNYKINKFTLAANSLTERDVYVFRMGAKVEGKFGQGNSKIIDYANSNFRSELMDIFLATKCLFAISCGTGSSHIAIMYRKPILDLNANLHHLMTFMKDSLLLAKHYYSKDKKRNLTLNEILQYEETSIRHRHNLDKYKIDIIDCTEIEIKDATIELLDRIDGIYKETEDVRNLQNKYKLKNWNNITKFINEKKYYFHKKIRANYSSNFLLNNKDWLN